MQGERAEHKTRLHAHITLCRAPSLIRVRSLLTGIVLLVHNQFTLVHGYCVHCTRIAGVEERAVTIGGTKEQQIKAGELIFSLMQETIQTSTYKNMSTNYGHQQPEYGHQPRAPAYSSYPPPQYRAYGSRYSPAPATSPRIPQRTGAQQTITLQVPDSIVGALVGKGGKVIIEMQSQSGAKIQISNREQMVEGTTDRVVTITGNDHAVATAQYLVNQKIQHTQQARAQYSTAGTAYAAVASY